MTMGTTKPAFQLGQVFVTSGALQSFSRDELMVCLLRHSQCDWGDVDAEDREANNRSLRIGSRILSAYIIGDRKVWIITDAEGDRGTRESTTVLLPDEY